LTVHVVGATDLEDVLAEFADGEPGEYMRQMSWPTSVPASITQARFSASKQYEASSRTRDLPCRLSAAGTARRSVSSTSPGGTEGSNA